MILLSDSYAIDNNAKLIKPNQIQLPLIGYVGNDDGDADCSTCTRVQSAQEESHRVLFLFSFLTYLWPLFLLF